MPCDCGDQSALLSSTCSKYTATDRNVDTQENEFYDELIIPVHESKDSHVLVVAGNFKAEAGKLSIDECCTLPAQRTDDEDRLLQFYAANRFPARIFDTVRVG